MTLLIHRKDEKRKLVDRVHGGEGSILLKRIFDGQINSQIYIYEATMRPQAYVNDHIHIGTEETLYVVSGKILITIDGNPFTLHPGDAALTKSGSKHAFKNISAKESKVIVFSGTTSIIQRMINLILHPIIEKLQDRGGRKIINSSLSKEIE